MAVYKDLKKMGINGDEDWYFGLILRDQSHKILLKEHTGTYLLRSRVDPLGFALSVKDANKVSHFKIQGMEVDKGYSFVIGVMKFNTIQEIIKYFENTTLSDSNLTRPATRPTYRAIHKYDPDNDQESKDEVSLKKGERVEFMGVYAGQNGEANSQWWRVRKSTGEIGFVPANFLKELECVQVIREARFAPLLNLPTPFLALAVRCRLPNIFDQSQLPMQPEDEIEVWSMEPDLPEQWYGFNRTRNVDGQFPFNYVRPLESVVDEEKTSSGSNRTSRVSAATLEDCERL